jgi:hypothetical protein
MCADLLAIASMTLDADLSTGGFLFCGIAIRR